MTKYKKYQKVQDIVPFNQVFEKSVQSALWGTDTCPSS